MCQFNILALLSVAKLLFFMSFSNKFSIFCNKRGFHSNKIFNFAVK